MERADTMLACACGQTFPIGRLVDEALTERIKEAWREHHQGPQCAPATAAAAEMANLHREAILEDVIRQHDLTSKMARDARWVGCK